MREEAHENAQSIIPESFSTYVNRKGQGQQQVQILEEARILSESRNNVELAKTMLSTFDADLIAFHITRQTAEIILRTQETEIDQLQRDGILCERDAEHLIEEVHRESSKIQHQSVNHIWKTRISASTNGVDGDARNDADYSSDTNRWRELLPPKNVRSRFQHQQYT